MLKGEGYIMGIECNIIDNFEHNLSLPVGYRFLPHGRVQERILEVPHGILVANNAATPSCTTTHWIPIHFGDFSNLKANFLELSKYAKTKNQIFNYSIAHDLSLEQVQKLLGDGNIDKGKKILKKIIGRNDLNTSTKNLQKL